jgi:ribosomal protein L37AE/L43A
MIESEFIRCPLCNHILQRETIPGIRLWSCDDCGSTFTPQQLAEEWENKEFSNPQGTQETDTPASNFL